MYWLFGDRRKETNDMDRDAAEGCHPEPIIEPGEVIEPEIGPGEVIEPETGPGEVIEPEIEPGEVIEPEIEPIIESVIEPETGTDADAELVQEKPASPSIESLLVGFSRKLSAEIHTLGKVLENQEYTIQRQHLTISKFQEDLLYKLQKPLIMEIIGIADNIRMILQEQEAEKNYDLLHEGVKNLEQWVEATLSNNSVRSFRDTEYSAAELNRKRQEVIDSEVTDDPEKNNTYVSERPGYLWTMPYLIVNSDVQLEKIVRENNQPQLFSYVIRPEEVIKLKYRKK